MTSDTVTMISIRVDFTVPMALRMRSERSYTGTTLTPSGSPAATSLSRALTASITVRAFWSCRMTMMPETTSPVPSRSARPLR
jgi:hypothetical protein